MKIQNRLAEIKARYDAAVNTPWFDGKYSVNDSTGSPVACQFTYESDKRFIAQTTRDIPWLLDLVKDLYYQLDEQKEQIAFIDTLLDDNIRIGDAAERLEQENKDLRLDLESARVEQLPLTLEQIKNMVGEPIWVCDLPMDEAECLSFDKTEKATIHSGLDFRFKQFGTEVGIIRWEVKYGETWVAYARRPEQTQQ